MARPGPVLLAVAILCAGVTSLIADSPPSQPTSTRPSGSFRCPATEPIRDRPPDDANADPFSDSLWYVNADRTLWSGWDVVRMVSGEKGNKVLWIRPQGTQLKVSGRRLDAGAPPLKARIPCCYPTGFQATCIIVPTEGCWEITAKAGASELTFVTEVTTARVREKTLDEQAGVRPSPTQPKVNARVGMRIRGTGT